MQRRDVVRALGLAAAGVAGCSEAPSPTPQPPTGTPPGTVDRGRGGGGITTRASMRADFDVREGDEGKVQLEVVVTNPANVPRRVEMTVVTTVGDQEDRVVKLLDLDSGESRTLTFTLPFDHERWRTTSSSVDFRWDYMG